jgi:2-dehydro-3-deoxyphosphogluconate aldolase / (4S)-4-hydroxy-2-oxoglutarate aldolase
MNIREVMQIGPLVPVLTIINVAHAVPLAKAPVAGGIRVLKITLRTEAGLAAARVIAEQVSESIVGTVA